MELYIVDNSVNRLWNWIHVGQNVSQGDQIISLIYRVLELNTLKFITLLFFLAIVMVLAFFLIRQIIKSLSDAFNLNEFVKDAFKVIKKEFTTLPGIINLCGMILTFSLIYKSSSVIDLIKSNEDTTTQQTVNLISPLLFVFVTCISLWALYKFNKHERLINTQN